MNGKGIVLAGIITDIFPVEVFANFEKRVLWLKNTGEKYPELWQIEFQQGDCDKLDKFKTGDSVIVTVDIKGRGFEKSGKKAVYNTLKGVDIGKQGGERVARSNCQQTGRADGPQRDANAYNDGEASY